VIRIPSACNNRIFSGSSSEMGLPVLKGAFVRDRVQILDPERENDHRSNFNALRCGNHICGGVSLFPAPYANPRVS
jgi:hypothetical protein